MIKLFLVLFEFLKIKENIKSQEAQILLDKEKETTQFFGSKAIVQSIAMLFFGAIGSLGLAIILHFSTINVKPGSFSFGIGGYFLGGFLVLFLPCAGITVYSMVRYLIAQFKQNKRAFSWICLSLCSLFLGCVIAAIVLAILLF